MKLDKRPELKSPIEGNDRLEFLRQLIRSGEATTGEIEEFKKTYTLYSMEGMHEKPFREHPEWYQEVKTLRAANEASRVNA